MFGYITADSRTMQREDKARYQSVYCGLCRRLNRQYGNPGRAALTYDMTFVAILLSSLYHTEEAESFKRCGLHPLRKGAYISSAVIEYAADMNIILAYYKYLDDWNDDRNARARRKSKSLEQGRSMAKDRWPRQYTAISECMEQLGQMEKDNELNPDKPANCFGVLMGEVLVMQEDSFSAALRRMGAALGRFIYLLDASNDLKADIKKERYNPLIAQTDTNFKPMLDMLMSECTGEFEKLPLERDLPILRNVLYSGVWTRYLKR